jgi:hypothetical protein
MGEMRRAQFHEFGEAINRDFLGEMLGNMILNPPKLPNRQTTDVLRRLL